MCWRKLGNSDRTKWGFWACWASAGLSACCLWRCLLLILPSQNTGILMNVVIMYVSYLVLLDTTCVNLPAKMLLELLTVRAFVKIISIPDEELFSGTTVGCIATKFIKKLWCPFGFVLPSASALIYLYPSGWLSLDIEWFVLFLCPCSKAKRCEQPKHIIIFFITRKITF